MKSFSILFVLLIHSGAALAQQYLISTVAGIGGSPGWSGDTGPALDAQFFNPLRVALDAQGDIYITDYNNYSVRRVDANTDIVTTVAGNGSAGYSGFKDGSSMRYFSCLALPKSGTGFFLLLFLLGHQA